MKNDHRLEHRAGLVASLALALLVSLSVMTAVAAQPAAPLAKGAAPESIPGAISPTSVMTWTVRLPLVYRGYAPSCFRLTIAVEPAGSGTVGVNPPPNCGGDRYYPGSLVTLTANPSPGWAFAGWSGSVTSSESPVTFAMDTDKTVTANFAPQEYTLTVDVIGSGTVAVDPEQATYLNGEVVTLTATPDPGWVFAGWGGALTGGVNPASLTMDGDKQVTATFATGAVGPLVYAGHTVDDASLGDGDGIVECSETVQVGVNLTNEGDVVALAVSARAETNDAYVTWASAGSAYPDIPGAATAANVDAFELSVAGDAPDGHVIAVTLTMTATNGGTWTEAFPLLVTCAPGGNSVDAWIAASSDDAEEEDLTGQVDLVSAVLELGEGCESQQVGLRFADITVPQGVTITRAYISFTAAEPASEATALLLQGEASDDAPTFQDSAFDISARETTTASVAWDDVPPWTAKHAVYDTPDLTPIVQEIVDREGWSSGNAMAFVITGDGGRPAVAYDGIASLAPRLHIVYEDPGPPLVWDPRLDLLGVTLERATRVPGQPFWKLIEARWADPAQSQGLHHIYFEVLDEGGSRVLGQRVTVAWPNNSVEIVIEDKPPPEYGGNFAMYRVLGNYNAWVSGPLPSDRVLGMGLGTIEQPNFTIHTSFYLTFQRVP